MEITLQHNNREYTADLSSPIDISIPLIAGVNGPKCFSAPDFTVEPVISGDWIGDINQGGSVNFKTITINPHGNGTHTECVGHISTEDITINKVLTNFHFIAELITIKPSTAANGDKIITLEQMISAIDQGNTEALILRTLPNDTEKIRKNYSGTNPPYIDPTAIKHLVHRGIKHLLIDLPSVDREEDDGKLASHKGFWNYPDSIDKKKTITEMVYIHNSIPDGLYLLNIQIASIEIDASPSKPVLYNLSKK